MSTALPELKVYEPYRRLSRAEREQFGKDLRVHYENGASLRNLASRTGRGHATIRVLLQMSGTTMRPPGVAGPRQAQWLHSTAT